MLTHKSCKNSKLVYSPLGSGYFQGSTKKTENVQKRKTIAPKGLPVYARVDLIFLATLLKIFEVPEIIKSTHAPCESCIYSSNQYDLTFMSSNSNS